MRKPYEYSYLTAPNAQTGGSKPKTPVKNFIKVGKEGSLTLPEHAIQASRWEDALQAILNLTSPEIQDKIKKISNKEIRSRFTQLNDDYTGLKARKGNLERTVAFFNDFLKKILQPKLIKPNVKLQIDDIKEIDTETLRNVVLITNEAKILYFMLDSDGEEPKMDQHQIETYCQSIRIIKKTKQMINANNQHLQMGKKGSEQLLDFKNIDTKIFQQLQAKIGSLQHENDQLRLNLKSIKQDHPLGLQEKIDSTELQQMLNNKISSLQQQLFKINLQHNRFKQDRDSRLQALRYDLKQKDIKLKKLSAQNQKLKLNQKEEEERLSRQIKTLMIEAEIKKNKEQQQTRIINALQSSQKSKEREKIMKEIQYLQSELNNKSAQYQYLKEQVDRQRVQNAHSLERIATLQSLLLEMRTNNKQIKDQLAMLRQEHQKIKKYKTDCQKFNIKQQQQHNLLSQGLLESNQESKNSNNQISCQIKNIQDAYQTKLYQVKLMFREQMQQLKQQVFRLSTQNSTLKKEIQRSKQERQRIKAQNEKQVEDLMSQIQMLNNLLQEPNSDSEDEYKIERGIVE